jgi:hypothetical protein
LQLDYHKNVADVVMEVFSDPKTLAERISEPQVAGFVSLLGKGVNKE